VTQKHETCLIPGSLLQLDSLIHALSRCPPRDDGIHGSSLHFSADAEPFPSLKERATPQSERLAAFLQSREVDAQWCVDESMRRLQNFETLLAKEWSSQVHVDVSQLWRYASEQRDKLRKHSTHVSVRTVFHFLWSGRLAGSAGAHGICGTGSKYNGGRQAGALTEGGPLRSLALARHVCHAGVHD
jgi:hypothetical protein